MHLATKGFSRTSVPKPIKKRLSVSGYIKQIRIFLRKCVPCEHSHKFNLPSLSLLSQETKDTNHEFTQSASPACNMSIVHIFMLQSQICIYVPLQRLSQITLSEKTHQLYYCSVLMAPAVISTCYGKKKKKKKEKRTIASCKVVNNLFFLYINLYENNITYVL